MGGLVPVRPLATEEGVDITLPSNAVVCHSGWATSWGRCGRGGRDEGVHMTMRHLSSKAVRGWVLPGTAIAAALAMAACSGEGMPGPATSTGGSGPGTVTSAATPTGPTNSSSSSSSTSRPVTSTTVAGDPNVPAAARVNTDAGAEEFVKYYVQQINRALSGPDSTLLPRISMDSCKTCASINGSAAQLALNGQRYVGVPIVVERLGLTSKNNDRQVFVGVYGNQPPSRIVDSHGKTVRTGTLRIIAFEFELKFTDRWQTAAIRTVKS